eukprot:TRINITY_DN951_c0_g2_i1.p1 TRINITY_DN951_c0_g2~~TRINITY_DN951_c0_g2_i1.p1  ORF type:complete len:240 (+),score=48.17 TRINITY_DN951_c0_g2_i1:113-832(+)
MDKPMKRRDVAKVLSAMLEQRIGGAQPEKNKQLEEWEREGRVGGEYGAYKYTMNNGDCITIREGVHELGHRVWDTCIQVCKMLEKNEGLVKEKVVLELGAGCGLLSVVAARMGARKVIATDLPVVLDHLKANTVGESCVIVQDLRWGEQADVERLPSTAYDLVVGSDVTITPHAVPSLVKTLTALTANTVIITGPNHREGWRTFKNEAAKHFTVTDIPSSDLNPEYVSKRVGMVYLSRV